MNSAYLIHWTSTRADEIDERPLLVDTTPTAVMSTTRVHSDTELIGFLLNLPGDGTFVIRGVTETAS